MIQKQTVLNVADNSGAKKVRCIGMGSRNGGATIGMIIKVSVIKAEANSNVKSGTVHDAVIVRVKSFVSRGDGLMLSSSDNAAVLIDAKKQMIGTRVIGSVARECKEIDTSIVSRAQEVH